MKNLSCDHNVQLTRYDVWTVDVIADITVERRSVPPWDQAPSRPALFRMTER